MGDEHDDAFLGLLQQVTKCANLLRVDLVDAKSLEAAAVKRLAQSAPELIASARGYLDEAVSKITESPATRRYWGDVLTHVSHRWSAIGHEIHEGTTAQFTAEIVERCIKLVDETTLATGLITIPRRLGDFMQNMANGDSISFETYFGDELPNPEMRKRLLTDLSEQTLLVDGYVDVDEGTITKVSTSRAGNWVALLVALAVAVLSGVALVVLNGWNEAPGLPEPDKRVKDAALLRDLALVWTGMVAHVLLGWHKRLRENRAPHSARRVLYLLRAKEMSIWTAIGVGAVLSYAFAATGQISEPLALIAVGYSADSILEAIVPRLDARLVEMSKTITGP